MLLLFSLVYIQSRRSRLVYLFDDFGKKCLVFLLIFPKLSLKPKNLSRFQESLNLKQYFKVCKLFFLCKKVAICNSSLCASQCINLNCVHMIEKYKKQDTGVDRTFKRDIAALIHISYPHLCFERSKTTTRLGTKPCKTCLGSFQESWRLLYGTVCLLHSIMLLFSKHSPSFTTS